MMKMYCYGKKDYCPHYDGVCEPNCHELNCEHIDNSGVKYIEIPNTNYDRIKNMSVDEMAEFISKDLPFCGYADDGNDCVFGWRGGNCAEHAKKWLESEVE